MPSRCRTKTIVVTDALVELAADDREVLAVLAHELGRHGLRAILRNSGAALLLAAVFGDLVSLTSSAAVLPTVLLRSGYSRDLEGEADAFALALLEEAELDPAWFARLLGRLEALGDLGPSLLSTHPHPEERRAAALRAARDPALGDPGVGADREEAPSCEDYLAPMRPESLGKRRRQQSPARRDVPLLRRAAVDCMALWREGPCSREAPGTRTETEPRRSRA